MNQTTKLCAATTLALGTLIGATVVGTASPIHQKKRRRQQHLTILIMDISVITLIL